jgi:BASS family bile acid:Na+ symporter
VASIVMIPILIPLLAGIGFGHIAPALAARIASPVSLVAMLLLLVSLVPILFVATPALVALIGNGVLACLIAFALVGLCVGHFLGGPDSDNRTVLAIATAARHPGMAIAIASLTFPDEKAVMAVVLYHVILGGIVAVPYVKWRSHQAVTA